MDLTFKPNNLYRNGSVVQFSDGDEILVRDTLTINGTLKDTYYTVKQDDEISILAYRFYSPVVEDSSKYWWIIADANDILNPLDLTEWVGKEILIPNILTVILNLE